MQAAETQTQAPAAPENLPQGDSKPINKNEHGGKRAGAGRKPNLLKRGLPVHVVNHLTAMADLHRAGRFDRMSDDVLALTGQRPLSVQEFVRNNAAAFTAAAKAKEA